MNNLHTKGLGFRPDDDPRDQNFPMKLRARVSRRETRRWAYFDTPLDQGSTGTCVGHAGKHLLAAGPVIKSDIGDRPSAIEIYLEACKHDSWPENDHGDLQFGTSMNALGHALRGMGFINRWEHAYAVDEIADFLAGVDQYGKHVGGPVCLGLPWYTGMFETDAEGFIHVTGSPAGGHAICAFLWNESKAEIWGPNSWGNSFGKWHEKRGQDGYWRMSADTLHELLKRGGEAVMMKEIVG